MTSARLGRRRWTNIRCALGPCTCDIAIEQMRRSHVAQRVRHDRADVRVVALELREQRRHRIALEAVLRAAQIARDDRKRELAGIRGDIYLRALDEWTDHREAAV